MYQKLILKIIYLNQFYSLSFTYGAILKGCPHIREGGGSGGSGKSGQMLTGGGGGLIGTHMCVHPVSEWSVFFTLLCELFTSCNVSKNASLVSARTGRGESGQPNVDRPGQGEVGCQKFPNLCAHPLWMAPIEKIDIRSFLNRINKKGIWAAGQNNQKYILKTIYLNQFYSLSFTYWEDWYTRFFKQD